MAIDGVVNPNESQKIDLDKLKPPTDRPNNHKFSNIGPGIQKAISVEGAKKIGLSAIKGWQAFQNDPVKKASKSETCFWLAALCALVATAIIVGISIGTGPAGILMAIQLGMIPGMAGAFLLGKGFHEWRKERKLKDWEMPKIPEGVDPIEAERRWHARNTAKDNIEHNQTRITELKASLWSPSLSKESKDRIQAEIEQRKSDKLTLFKSFEDKAVSFWDLARPEKGAALKESFNEARVLRGEKDLLT